MSDPGGSMSAKVDLSSVPEPMRSMLLNQLAKMPPTLREKLLQEGSPLLDRMIAKAREHAAQGIAALPASAAESDPDGDGRPVGTTRNSYSASAPGRVPTVMPGDSGSNGAWLLACAIGLILAVWYALRG